MGEAGWPRASTAGPAWLKLASFQHPAASGTSEFKGDLCSPLHAKLMLMAALGLLQHSRVCIVIIWPSSGALPSTDQELWSVQQCMSCMAADI